MITNSYLEEKKYPSVKERQKLPGKSSPFIDHSRFSYSSFPKSNILNNSEPLNSISQNLSFKGSFLPKKLPAEGKIITIQEALSRFGNEFGTSATKHLEETIKNVSSKPAETGIKREGDTLKFTPESNWKKIKDILLYPILKMHLDIANGFVDFLKKIPGIKDFGFVKKWAKSKALQGRKDEIKLISEAAAVERFFKEASENKNFKAFKDAHGRLKPFVSNYSTTIERSVTRFVTGIIPAFFLANDAYNLSMYMNNNKNVAKKEKERRFNQEVARIGITTALTFGVFSFFSKKSNSSQAMTTMLMAGATFVSEFLGRMWVGTPVLPIDKETAKKYAQKRQQSYNKEKDKNKKIDKKPSDAFKGNDTKNHKQPPEKGVLTFENVLKVVAALIVFGYAVDKVKKVDSVAKKLHEWGEKYGSHFKEKITIERKEFNELMKNLHDNGFEEMAKKYKEMVADQKGDNLYLGEQVKKVKNTLVNDILLFPITFVWKSIILMPWKLVKTADKAINNSIQKASKTKGKVAEQAKENMKEWQRKAKDKADKEKNLSMLRDSVEFLKTIGGDKNYKTKLSENLISGLDNVTKSNYSNAEMASVFKTTANSVTSGFLIVDTYNLVMIDSQGQDTELASQKAKERTIQRGVRIAYGAFLQQLFNNIFKRTFDGSILGAQLVNTGSTFATETMERKSVGLPLGESTREQIISTEQENLNARGLKGAYYRAMAKLTGKKALSERATASN